MILQNRNCQMPACQVRYITRNLHIDLQNIPALIWHCQAVWYLTYGKERQSPNKGLTTELSLVHAGTNNTTSACAINQEEPPHDLPQAGGDTY